MVTRVTKEVLDALVLPPLEWNPWWYQDGGYREYANPPEGNEYYHVSAKGWWQCLGYLTPCDSIEDAKAAVEADRKKRLYAMFGFTP